MDWISEIKVLSVVRNYCKYYWQNKQFDIQCIILSVQMLIFILLVGGWFTNTHIRVKYIGCFHYASYNEVIWNKKCNAFMPERIFILFYCVECYSLSVICNMSPNFSGTCRWKVLTWLRIHHYLGKTSMQVSG